MSEQLFSYYLELLLIENGPTVNICHCLYWVSWNQFLSTRDSLEMFASNLQELIS